MRIFLWFAITLRTRRDWSRMYSILFLYKFCWWIVKIHSFLDSSKEFDPPPNLNFAFIPDRGQEGNWLFRPLLLNSDTFSQRKNKALTINMYKFIIWISPFHTVQGFVGFHKSSNRSCTPKSASKLWNRSNSFNLQIRCESVLTPDYECFELEPLGSLINHFYVWEIPTIVRFLS